MAVLVVYGMVLAFMVAAYVVHRRHVNELRADPVGRVRLGAARLDTVYPRWAEQIDAQRLNLRSIRTCVLGQVFGSYGNGLDALGIVGMGRRHGFFTLGDKDTRTLTALWHGEIVDRQRAAARKRAEADARRRRQAWAAILAFQENWDKGYNNDEALNYKQEAMRAKVLASA